VNHVETTTTHEIHLLVKYSIPLIIAFLLQYSLTVALVFSVGRLGSSQLAAISLSSMTANVTGYAIIQGVSTCLDTLCAQAYGRRNYNLVGVHFWQCNYLLMLIYVPIGVLWTCLIQHILARIIPHEPELVNYALLYLKVIAVGLPGFILFENAKHFLQAQGIFHAATYVLFVCAPVNAMLNYFLVWDKTIGMGFVGAPISVAITNWLMCFMIYGYIFFVDGYQCWPLKLLLHRSFFRNWGKMIDLSIPGVLMVEAEWLAFEIITFTASMFGTEVLAAQSIINTTCTLLYQIPFAISIAASTRVAWYIGAAAKHAAKTASFAAVFLSLTIGVFNATLVLTSRHWFASLFTSDASIIELAAKVLIIVAFYQINDFLSCSTAGILRGQGRQKIGGYLSLISYYCIAIPLAAILAFYFQLELVGLWLGMIFALFFVSVLQYYFVATSDWDWIINECLNDGFDEPVDALPVVPTMSSALV
jgi:MATE family multidrug resistance protein